MPTGDELTDYWMHHPSLGRAEREIIRVLREHRNGLDIDDLATKTNYEVSGGFKNRLATLRTARIILGRNTETMRLSDQFFM